METNNISSPASNNDRFYLLRKKVEDRSRNEEETQKNKAPKGRMTYFAAMIGSFSAIFMIIILILVIAIDSKPKINEADIVIPTSLHGDALEAWGKEMLETSAAATAEWFNREEEFTGDDILKMTDKLSLLKQLTFKEERPSLRKAIEQNMFSWLKGPSSDRRTLNGLLNSYKNGGKGLVMSTGNDYFSIAVHAIKVIRHLGCTLPIEIFYMGKKDLTDARVKHLNGMPGVLAVDINDSFDNGNPELSLVGFDIKPFTVMASTFREAMFVDADIVFMEDPSILFADPSYKETGALFFYDRFFGKDSSFKDWLHSIVRQPSRKLKKSHLYKGESSYEQDSGVLIIDKVKHFWAMLASLRLNCQKERDVIHSRTWGDKETFWLAFEMMGEHYSWYDRRVGTIGARAPLDDEEPIFCGHMAHFTKNGKRLLWLQDSILEDKRDYMNSKPMEYEYYTLSGGWDQVCSRTRNIKKIPADQLVLLEQFRQLWIKDPLRT